MLSLRPCPIQATEGPAVVVVVQSLSPVRLFVTTWTVALQASLFITISQSLLKLRSIELVMPSHPLLSLSLLAFNLSQHEDLCSESVLHIRWPKYWSSSLNIIPSSEYSGLISFRIDWLDLLSIQGTLKSLLQHYSSKASILRRSAFFIIQISHQYSCLDNAMDRGAWWATVHGVAKCPAKCFD